MASKLSGITRYKIVAAHFDLTSAHLQDHLPVTFTLEDGRKVTKPMVRQLLSEELPRIRKILGPAAWDAGKYEDAAQLFEEITTCDEYTEFLTLPAYEFITRDACAPREGDVAQHVRKEVSQSGRATVDADS